MFKSDASVQRRVSMAEHRTGKWNGSSIFKLRFQPINNMTKIRVIAASDARMLLVFKSDASE